MLKRTRVQGLVAPVLGLLMMVGTSVPLFGQATRSTDGFTCPSDAKPANLNFTLRNLNGRDVRLVAYKGQVILLDFWATWCGPCKVEIPWFVEFQTRYGAQGLQVLGISIDDTVDKLKPYAAQFKMNYPVLQGLGRDEVVNAYGPMIGLPTTFVIGRDGRICARHTGLGSKESFDTQIKALLSERR